MIIQMQKITDLKNTSDCEYIKYMSQALSHNQHNLPIFQIDTNAWDYIRYDKEFHLYILDTVSASARAYSVIQNLIENRSASINIAFYRRPPFYSWEQTALYLAQNCDTLAHSAIWFGEDIAEMMISDAYGIAFKTLPPDPEVEWELFRLPFNGTEAVVRAFEIANYIVIQTSKQYIGYGYRALRVIESTLFRLIGKQECMLDCTEDDFDYRHPETWIGGVHCTQLVMLFLKRCVEERLISIPCNEKRQHFMNINSHVCMPCDLMDLLHDLWDPPKIKNNY
jgi:hypothetical protein